MIDVIYRGEIDDSMDALIFAVMSEKEKMQYVSREYDIYSKTRILRFKVIQINL